MHTVVNLNAAKSTIVKQIREACLTSGFFYLKFDGIIDPQLVADAFEVSKEFFELDAESKAAYSKKGYSAYQTETLNPQQQTEGDTKQGFSIKSTEPIDADPQCNLPDKWNAKTTKDVTGIMQQYLQQLTAIGIQLAEILALALELPADAFMPYLKQPRRYIRMLCYSPRVSNPDTGVYAAGAHSDYGFITLLATDDQPGLEIQDKSGAWHVMPVMPGHFIVNTGDMLERLSDGLFKSPVHRVINVTGKSRYSIPFFFNVNENMVIKPLVTNPKSIKLYPPITFLEYLDAKTKQTFKGVTPNQSESSSNL